MKHHDVAQGSAAWFQLRAGMPTASCFDKILTPKKLQRSSQSNTYLHRLLGEWMTGQVFETETRVWAMDQGIEREQEAVEYFEITTGLQTSLAGFFTNDAGTIGCSPDRLVNDGGLLEVKAPLAATHVGYLLAGIMPSEYELQTQGQLFVTQKPWVWWESYYPGMPALLIKITPKEEIQRALETCLSEFCGELEAGKRKLRQE